VGTAKKALAIGDAVRTCSDMFMVDEMTITAIREAFAEGGEFAAAVELRRRFPGIVDNAEARSCARTIAGWEPLPPPREAPPRSRRSGKQART